MSNGHPAIVKAKRIGAVGFEFGWKGTIEKESAITELDTWRNDELIKVRWLDNHMTSATYEIFGHVSELACAADVLKVLRGWPEVIKLFKLVPEANRPTLVERYRRLPFDEKTDDSELIIAKLTGAQIHWYSHTSAQIYSDTVKIPKRKQVMEIKPVGHRKLFNFIGTQGFRSVLLDTILQVDE